MRKASLLLMLFALWTGRAAAAAAPPANGPVSAAVHVADELLLSPVEMDAWNHQQTQEMIKDLLGDAAAGAGRADIRPRLSSPGAPVYPSVARSFRVQGRVLARVLVGGAGQVIRVGRVTGPAALEPAVRAAAATWRFEPSPLRPDSLAVWVTVPVRFVL